MVNSLSKYSLGPVKTSVLRGTPRTYAMKIQAVTDIRQLKKGPLQGDRGPVTGTDGPVRGTEGHVTGTGPFLIAQNPF